MACVQSALFPLVKGNPPEYQGVEVMKKTEGKKQKTLKKEGMQPVPAADSCWHWHRVVLATVILSTTSLRLTRTNLKSSVQTTLHVTADNLAKYCKENEITAMNASGYYEVPGQPEGRRPGDGHSCRRHSGHPSIKMKMTIVSVKSPWIRILCPPVDGGYYDKNVVIEGNIYYMVIISRL